MYRNVLEFFVLEVTARVAADLLHIHSNSAALFYYKIREVINYHLTLQAQEIMEREIEINESYFGGVCKGKRGRGAGAKVAVFGLLKRQGKVYTVIVNDTKSKTLLTVIKGKQARQYCLYGLLSQ